MSRTRKFWGIVIAISADCGVAVFLTTWLSLHFHQPVTIWWYLTGTAIILAPDADLLIGKMHEHKLDSRHRQYLGHCPLIGLFFVKMVRGIAVTFGGNTAYWTWLPLLALLWHYLHDSTGEANKWGVAWFAPINQSHFQFFGWQGGQRRMLCVWERSAIAQCSPVTLEEWLATYYLRPTAESIGGVIILLGALIHSLI